MLFPVPPPEDSPRFKPYAPTAEEIQEGCRQIQAQWSRREWLQRSGGAALRRKKLQLRLGRIRTRWTAETTDVIYHGEYGPD